jgi:small subunit ribosomal protein S9
MPTKSNKKYTFSVRRKSAVVTLKLFPGKGESIVNGKKLELYFPETFTDIDRVFAVIKASGKYFFEAKIVGGGKSGQLQALCLSIARGLKKIDEKFTSDLRQAGYLTVDSRVRERRMVGTGGKARRQKQSPKR